MIYRAITEKIDRDLRQFPAVAIIGPRQAGKTTLAKSLQTSLEKDTLYLDLEWEPDFNKLSDAGAFLEQHSEKCVIIDEVQLLPRLFPLLRSLIDRRREPARFILLGSASPALLKESAESLAGRISYHELTPFSLPEVGGNTALRTHWFRGGFPEALLAMDDEAAGNWLANFITTFVERDLSRLAGMEITSGNLLRFTRMLMHFHGKMLNVADISRSLDLAMQTVNKYLNLLEGAFLTVRLEPYFKNVGKRLVKAPRFYFRDSGFFHSLARLRSLDELLGSPFVGASWEGYVIEEIRRVGGKNWEYYFYRTQQGAEADLVLISPTGKLGCIEIKYSNAPVISKGFFQSSTDLEPVFRYVITPESETWTRSDGLTITSLSDFLRVEMVKFG